MKTTEFETIRRDFKPSSAPISRAELGRLGRLMSEAATCETAGASGDERTLFLGLDVGISTGLAIWDPAEKDFAHLTTLTFWRAVLCVYAVASPAHDVIVIEDPGMNRHMHSLKGDHTTRSAAKQGQRVGSVIEKTDLLVELLTTSGFVVIRCRPRGTKMPAATWAAVTGARARWRAPGVTSEHSRDAGMLVFGLAGTFESWRKKAEAGIVGG